MIIEEHKATKPWEFITADFVDMPATRHQLYKNVLNALLVVVDTFSKFTVLLPSRKEATTEEVYHLLWERIFAVFGVPRKMLSDRDKIFKTDKWADKMKAIGSEQLLSTAHHQQTDGQSERKIQELQAYYRHYLSYDQENWVELSPIAQLALNDVINATTGETPSFILYGTKRTKESLVPERDEHHTITMNIIHKQVQLDIMWNKKETKKYYDMNRQTAPELRTGDYVYLRRRTIGKNEYNIKSKRASDKLDCIHLGPFKILEALPHENYKLALPKRMRVHPIFHVSLLYPATLRKSRNGNVETEEFEVESIIDKRINTQGKMEYLVKWTGYDPTGNTWEEATNLFCPEKVRDFEQKPDPRRNRRRQAR